MSAAEPSRDELLSALEAVRDAISIPNAATAGGQETRDKILIERAGHATVMLNGVLERIERGNDPDVSWSVKYLHERLAEHPAEGYKTWAEGVAELNARQKAGCPA